MMKKQHIHLIGIGGTGLSAIARVLLESGHSISGSDKNYSPIMDSLKELGAKIFVGHESGQIGNAELIIQSSAISQTNPEILAAKEKGIPVLKRSDFMGKLFDDKIGIAFAGTHGKTTTTAMAAWVWAASRLKPSYIIGGKSNNLKNNAASGKGEHFIIEADEYDDMFLGLHPKTMVITNLEHDHPDYFPTFERYLESFKRFANNLSENGTAILCQDDRNTMSLFDVFNENQNVLTYGTSKDSDYFADDLRLNTKGCYDFSVQYRSQDNIYSKLATISLKVPGKHNLLNALAVFAAAHQNGLEPLIISSALEEFSGTGRRFEIIGEIEKVIFIDDYAHHPSEIKATLQAARERFAGHRIWAVWQPHTFSRIKTLFNAFSTAFEPVDKVIITDIFAAREKDDGFSSKSILEIIEHPSIQHIPELEDVITSLENNLSAGDVVLVLSAGDAVKINTELIRKIKQNGLSLSS
ncbi:MAG: UDP-N-acetylmuramate--L-alanine ligase [Anaerolineaceae bacterium]|nr:UDP-N-acetylmuramate--L-alanine ligase [Anaerolineaceae bacterium]